MRSLKRYLRAYWQLFRLEHGLMYGIGVLAGIFVGDPNYSDVKSMICGFLTAVFLQASAFALNDYADYEVDVANRRLDRPLVRGELSRRTALLSAVLFLPLGLMFAWLISPAALAFAFALVLLGFAYDLKFKEFGLAGNIYIALSMAAPFAFGSIIAAGTIVPISVVLAAIAFLSGLGREIMKGIEDVEGDAIRNVRSVARMMGEVFAAKTAAALYAISVALSVLPLSFAEYRDPKYVLPVVITDTLLLRTAWLLAKGAGKKEIPKLRRETLVAMLFGLVAFLAGAF